MVWIIMVMSMFRETIINKIWSTCSGEMISTHKAIITWFDNKGLIGYNMRIFLVVLNVKLGDFF